MRKYHLAGLIFRINGMISMIKISNNDKVTIKVRMAMIIIYLSFCSFLLHFNTFRILLIVIA